MTKEYYYFPGIEPKLPFFPLYVLALLFVMRYLTMRTVCT